MDSDAAILMARINSLEARISSMSQDDLVVDLPVFTPDQTEPIHDFDPRWDADGKLIRRTGYRCVEGSAWESIAESAPRTSSNGTWWMKWTNTTDALPGVWSEGFDSSPPTQDSTCTVVLLWTIAEVDGAKSVEYHDRGSVKAIDWRDC